MCFLRQIKMCSRWIFITIDAYFISSIFYFQPRYSPQTKLLLLLLFYNPPPPSTADKRLEYTNSWNHPVRFCRLSVCSLQVYLCQIQKPFFVFVSGGGSLVLQLKVQDIIPQISGDFSQILHKVYCFFATYFVGTSIFITGKLRILGTRGKAYQVPESHWHRPVTVFLTSVVAAVAVVGVSCKSQLANIGPLKGDPKYVFLRTLMCLT